MRSELSWLLLMCGTAARLGRLETGAGLKHGLDGGCGSSRGRAHVGDQAWRARIRQRHHGGMFCTKSKTHDPRPTPLPKNCDCRYHIIVTNVNRKADAVNRNYRWRYEGGAAWYLAGFGLGESE